MKDMSPALTEAMGKGGGHTPIILKSHTANKISKKGWEWRYGHGKPFRIRRLTPKECERLQGFPDNWTKEGTDGDISDTQRYKMCGNAVSVPVIRAIVKKIIKYI